MTCECGDGLRLEDIPGHLYAHGIEPPWEREAASLGTSLAAPPDHEALRLAYQAGRAGGSFEHALNAANAVMGAVAAPEVGADPVTSGRFKAEWHRYLHQEGILVMDENEDCGPWHHRVFLGGPEVGLASAVVAALNEGGSAPPEPER